MWIQLGASLATFLTIGGLVILMFRIQQGQIAKKVDKEFYVQQQINANKLFDELKDTAKEGSEKLQALHLTVVKIATRMGIIEGGE
jgi:hypothetical protein